MPWPATHILVAEAVYDPYFSHLDRKEFILGTTFPDIRYPAAIDRELTHFKARSLSSIMTEPAFKAGLYFHSFVDEIWNTFVQSHETQLFSTIPHDRAMFHTMKILQDRYLFDQSDDWQLIVDYFRTILPEENRFGTTQKMVRRWHSLLAHYLSKPPDIGDLAMLKLSLPAELVNKIAGYYQKYQEDVTLRQIMTAFYDQINTLIDKTL